MTTRTLTPFDIIYYLPDLSHLYETFSNVEGLAKSFTTYKVILPIYPICT